MTTSKKPPVWFWVVSVIALLWNLVGVMNYLNQAFNQVALLEAMDQAQRTAFESIPAWATAAFAIARARGVPVLVDGAQAAAHQAVSMEELGCDFYTVSGHKMYGPTGIGALYGRKSLLQKMPPYHGGGEMILSVSFDETIYNDLPYKFEAGTPNIAGAIGLGAAIDYMENIGLDAIEAHEKDLLEYATAKVSAIDGLRIIGQADEKAGILSFNLGDVHPHDVGTILDQEGIAVRAGHHCAQPVLERLGVQATVRASFALYNTRSEIDRLVEGIGKVGEVFS